MIEAEKNDEEQTEAQAEKNDEVAAAQADVEKAVAAYNAAREALGKRLGVLAHTAYKVLKEAAPDESAVLDSSWDALVDAVEAAALEARPVGFALDWDLDALEFQLEYPMYEALIAVHADPADPLIIFIIPENIETLRASAALKQVAPVEWVACKEALAALRDRAPSEFAAHTNAVAQYYLGLKSGYDMERHALRLQEKYDALLDAEWHARWAETVAQQAEKHRDIGTAHAAMSAVSEAFKSAREADDSQAYEAAEKAYEAVAKALLSMSIGKKKALKESKEWQRIKKEAADQRRTRLNARNSNLFPRYNLNPKIARKKQPEPIDDDTPLDVDIDDDIPF